MPALTLNQLIIYKERLETLQANLTNLTGIPVFFIDLDGVFVTKPASMTAPCRMIQDTPSGLKHCKADFAGLIEKIKQSKKPFLNFCYAGFCGFAIPIIINNELLGLAIGCQALPQKLDNKIKDRLSSLLDELKLPDKGRFFEAMGNNVVMPVVQMEKTVSSLSEIITLFINYELELGDLIKQMINYYAELSLLYEISDIFALSLNAADASQYILERICEVMEADRASLMILDAETKELRIIFAKGIPETITKDVRVKLGEGIAGWVAREGKPLLVENIEDNPELKNMAIDGGHFKSSSFLSLPLICAPLKVENRVIGVINLTDKVSGKSFTTHDLELLSAVNAEIAMLIENKRLFDDLKELFTDTVRTLISALEAKDIYTSGHSQRVTECSLAIADELNLTATEKANLELAGLLHDIGKIAISKELLLKTTKLTQGEFDQIKKHSENGAEILKHIKQLSATIPYILHHHERFDGMGYPNGLRGEGIPLFSRILAVADAFDAMTSTRPYRAALSRETALAEVKKNAGTQFDPVVCEAFLNACENNRI